MLVRIEVPTFDECGRETEARSLEVRVVLKKRRVKNETRFIMNLLANDVMDFTVI